MATDLQLAARMVTLRSAPCEAKIEISAPVACAGDIGFFHDGADPVTTILPAGVDRLVLRSARWGDDNV
jgi:hypothetical protein